MRDRLFLYPHCDLEGFRQSAQLPLNGYVGSCVLKVLHVGLAMGDGFVIAETRALWQTVRGGV